MGLFDLQNSVGAGQPQQQRMPLLDASHIPQMPQGAAAPAAQPSKLQQLMERIRGAGANMMPQPSGAASLFSPDDISAARRQGLLHMGMGLLSSHSGGFAPLAEGVDAGQHAYNESLATGFSSRQAGSEYQRQQQMMSAREQINQTYQLPPDANEDQIIQNAQRKMMAYLSIGDIESAKTLAEPLKSWGATRDNKPTVVPAGSTLYDSEHNKALFTAAPNPAEAQSASLARDRYNLRREGLSFTEGQGVLRAYNSSAAQHFQAAHAYDNVQSAYNDAMRGDGPSQQMFIMNAIKMEHPNAIVRPGEKISMEDSQSLGAQFSGEIQHLFAGGKLTPATINAIMAQSKRTREAWRNSLQQIRGPAVNRARQYGLPEENLVDPYNNPFHRSPTEPDTAGAAAVNPLLQDDGSDQ